MTAEQKLTVLSRYIAVFSSRRLAPSGAQNNCSSTDKTKLASKETFTYAIYDLARDAALT
jgi:hypothetical protein